MLMYWMLKRSNQDLNPTSSVVMGDGKKWGRGGKKKSEFQTEERRNEGLL